jgi:hypothetical protein
MLAGGGLDRGGDEVVRQRGRIRAGEPEREQPLHQLLERLVEELTAAACIELLGTLVRRLEPEHLAREALERAVREGREAGGRQRPLGCPAEPRLHRGEHIGRGSEPPAVSAGWAQAGASLEPLRVDRGEGPGILQPGGSSQCGEGGRGHRVGGVAPQVGSHGRLEREAHARPAGPRSVGEQRNCVRGEVPLRRAGNGEQPLDHIGRSASRAAAPGDDDAGGGGERTSQAAAVERFRHGRPRVAGTHQRRQRGPAEHAVDRLALLVPEQGRPAPAGEARGIEAGDAEEVERTPVESLEREHVHAGDQGGGRLEHERRRGIGEPAGEGGAIHLRARSLRGLPSGAHIPDERAPDLDGGGLASGGGTGARVGLERLLLERGPEPRGVESAPPGLEEMGEPSPAGDALGQGEQGRRGLEQPLGSGRVGQVARLATPSGEGAEADLVGAVVTRGAQRLVADAGAAQERQRIETALHAQRGQEALLQEPGDVLGGGAARGEPGPEESHASGGGRPERHGRATGHGDAGILERPLELRGVLGGHDGECAAIERGSGVEGPPEGVDQRCRLAPRARSDDGLERMGGKALR